MVMNEGQKWSMIRVSIHDDDDDDDEDDVIINNDDDHDQSLHCVTLCFSLVLLLL